MPTIRMTPAELADLVKRCGAVVGPVAMLPTGTLAPSSAPEGPSEKDFTAEVIAAAQERGWVVAHFRGVRVQRKDGSVHYQTPVQGDGKGFPDLLLIHPERGRIMAAELKVGRNKPTPEQEDWLAAFRVAGVPAFVWLPGDWDCIVATLEDPK